MKKKVLIYALRMTVGGVEKALLGQLTQFPKEEYDVTIVFQNKVGKYLDFIPDYVKVEEHNEWKKVHDLVQCPLHQNIFKALKKGDIFQSIYLFGLYLMTKIQKSYKPLHDYVQTLISDYPGEYDLAIDYPGPTSFSANFVAKHVNAKEKWTWIHFDIDKFPIDKKVVAYVYKYFDRINIVSAEGKKRFERAFPHLADRTHVFYNIIDKTFILSQADIIPNPYKDILAKIVICTVGRISSEKGQLITISSLKSLLNKGYDIHWCYVGDGVDMQKCKDLANEYGIIDHVTFAGLQTNPYPWMKYCNMYIQPSVYEGYCITLAEAKLFSIPIVSTNFTGAFEQLEKYEPAHAIVECNALKIAEGIESIIQAL